MSDLPFDDPAGRTRFAWARTLMDTFVASLVVERLFFAGSVVNLVILMAPVAMMGLITLVRSRPLRREPQGVRIAIPIAVPIVVLGCVLFIAGAALLGVAESL